jgi:2-dehydro-3-deoxyphosphooctonate aldolase (KDO 8-P synthase)
MAFLHPSLPSTEVREESAVHEVELGAFKIGGPHKHVLIAGPCVIESEQLVLETAHRIAEITRALRLPYIFKSSYDKANRSSITSFRGPGLTAGVAVLRRVKEQVGVPILTDIHSVNEAAHAAEGADILQIPAFLCRQTDLLVAAAKTGKVVNVKKGQFLSPWEMSNVVKKLEESGATRIILTERGSSFGYNNLIVDMRSLPIMRELGYPVIFDATHSVQLPGGAGTHSSGQREFIAPLACAAAAAGCDGFFMEVHPHPDTALSDGPNMVPLPRLKPLLEKIMRVCEAVGKGPEVAL